MAGMHGTCAAIVLDHSVDNVHACYYSTFQAGSNGIRSIDTKITQTTNPIVDNYDQDNRIMHG